MKETKFYIISSLDENVVADRYYITGHCAQKKPKMSSNLNEAKIFESLYDAQEYLEHLNKPYIEKMTPFDFEEYTLRESPTGNSNEIEFRILTCMQNMGIPTIYYIMGRDMDFYKPMLESRIQNAKKFKDEESLNIFVKSLNLDMFNSELITGSIYVETEIIPKEYIPKKRKTSIQYIIRELPTETDDIASDANIRDFAYIYDVIENDRKYFFTTGKIEEAKKFETEDSAELYLEAMLDLDKDLMDTYFEISKIYVNKYID